jgi:hypothetical protein
MSENLLNDIFKDSYIKRDISLNNFKRFQISINNSFNINIPGIDTDIMLEKLLYSEVKSNIYKEIFNSITDTDNIDFIDYIGKNIDDGNLYKDIVSLILSNNFNYVITNAQIGSIIQDSQNFHFNKQFSNTSLRTSSTPYVIGSIGPTKVFVNPYMKFTDNRVIMFNGSYLNFRNLDRVEDVSNLNHHTNIRINFEADIKSTPSKIVFIIDSEKSEGYLQFKSLIRNINIDKILKDGKISE